MLQIRAGSVKWLNEEADPEVRAQFEHSMRYYELLDDEGHMLDFSQAMSRLHLPVSSLPISVQPDHSIWQSLTAGDSRIRIMDMPVLGLRDGITCCVSARLWIWQTTNASVFGCFSLPWCRLLFWRTHSTPGDGGFLNEATGTGFGGGKADHVF